MSTVLPLADTLTGKMNASVRFKGRISNEVLMGVAEGLMERVAFRVSWPLVTRELFIWMWTCTTWTETEICEEVRSARHSSYKWRR